MRYFKIFNRNVRAYKAYREISEQDFRDEVSLYLDDNPPCIEEEDEKRYFEALDEAVGEMIVKIEREAKGEYGFNTGDYCLYIRDDDANEFDLRRR